MKNISNATLMSDYIYIFAFFIGMYKRRRLNFIIYFIILMEILNFLKAVYNAPRPYMVDPEIKALDHSRANGHPSGHSMLGIFLLLSIFEEFCFGRKFWIKNSVLKTAADV